MCGEREEVGGQWIRVPPPPPAPPLPSPLAARITVVGRRVASGARGVIACPNLGPRTARDNGASPSHTAHGNGQAPLRPCARTHIGAVARRVWKNRYLSRFSVPVFRSIISYVTLLFRGLFGRDLWTDLGIGGVKNCVKTPPGSVFPDAVLHTRGVGVGRVVPFDKLGAAACCR